MEKKLKLVSMLLILAVVFSLISISMSLNFKNFTPIVSRNVIDSGVPSGNVGLVVEKNTGLNNPEGNLEINNEE